MAEFVTIRGMPQTVRALRSLPAEFASKNGGPIRGALYAAAKPMRDAAEENAPEGDTGNLKRAVYIFRDPNPQASGATERYVIAVRTRRLAKAIRRRYGKGLMDRRLSGLARRDAWYWHFVEFGTKKQPAQGFMTRAYEDNKSGVVPTFQREFAKAVRAAVLKARQKAGA